MSAMLEISDLYVRFRRPEGIIHAVNGVSFEVKEGEWLGLLGESGSGKSVSLLSLLKLVGDNATIPRGTALFNGQDLLQMKERQLRTVRGRDVGVVFQNLSAGLDPYMRVGRQIMEPMLEHGICGKTEAQRRATELLEEMGLPDPKKQFNSYPFELSGGMRQRVMLAVAMACNPKLLIADEPTTALDATVQTQVLSVLREACERRKMTTVMITHDLGVATNVCDRIVVMYGGRVMEVADVDEFIAKTAHPYTLGLKSSLLTKRHRGQPLRPIPGNAITLWQSPKGCPFANRCPLAVDRCVHELPELRPLSATHEVACHRAEEVSASVG